MSMLRLVLLALLLTGGAVDAAMTDGATKISFPNQRHGLDIFGVGVRKKGPIKIYSVALYCKSAMKEKLASISRKSDKELALKTLRNVAQSHESTFLLEMAMKVGAEKIAGGIATSLTPRHKGKSAEVDALKSLILKGVESTGGTAAKGTQLEFKCSPTAGVAVAVNGNKQGYVTSPELASAFCDIYLDAKSVSPALLDSCLETCCAP